MMMKTLKWLRFIISFPNVISTVMVSFSKMKISSFSPVASHSLKWHVKEKKENKNFIEIHW